MTASLDQEILRQHFPQCAWPALYYGVVPNLLKDVDAKNIAEIGVAYGYHAENILNSLKQVTYHGIDSYLSGYDPDDTFVGEVCRVFNEPEPQRAMDRLHSAVEHKLQAYGDRARLYREKSVEAAESFSEDYFDLIFIDGTHTYDAVKTDIDVWWPKLKSSGFLCGDDYSWASVRKAVDEFSVRSGRELEISIKRNTGYPVWVIRK